MCRLNRLSQEISNDRERVDSKLNCMEDSTVIKEYIHKVVKQSEEEAKEALEREVEELRKRIDRIYTENLLVPGIIGPLK